MFLGFLFTATCLLLIACLQWQPYRRGTKANTAKCSRQLYVAILFISSQERLSYNSWEARHRGQTFLSRNKLCIIYGCSPFLAVTTTYQASCYILYFVTSVHAENFLKVKLLMFCVKDEKNPTNQTRIRNYRPGIKHLGVPMPIEVMNATALLHVYSDAQVWCFMANWSFKVRIQLIVKILSLYATVSPSSWKI